MSSFLSDDPEHDALRDSSTLIIDVQYNLLHHTCLALWWDVQFHMFILMRFKSLLFSPDFHYVWLGGNEFQSDKLREWVTVRELVRSVSSNSSLNLENLLHKRLVSLYL